MKVKITKKYMDAERIDKNNRFEVQVKEYDYTGCGFLIDLAITDDEWKNYRIHATNKSGSISFPVQRFAQNLYTREDLNIYLYDDRDDILERAVDSSIRNELSDIIKKHRNTLKKDNRRRNKK